MHKDKKEIAFVFDSSLIESAWYGNTVFECILPALNKESTYSILCGDIIADSLPKNIAEKAILGTLIRFHETTFRHPTQYYVVYINNLSERQLNLLIQALSKMPFFIGYADMTFSSSLKTVLAHSLINLGIKHRDTMILQHEADREDQENVNNSGYNWEGNGFAVKSISDMYFGLFLSYKIESLMSDHEDLRYSLSAIYSNTGDAFTLPISVLENKLLYLKENKSGIMEKLQLKDYSTKELESLIKKSVQRSYFYNLDYLEEYGVPKFNISLELVANSGEMRKVLVALKYSKQNEALELITMY